jgi:hypothetical protein
MPDNLSVTIAASVQGLVDGLKQATDAVKEHATQVKDSVDHIAGAFESIIAPFEKFAFLLGGGVLFKKALQGSVEWTLAVRDLALATGTSTEEASGLMLALNRVGMATQTYVQMTTQLGRALRMNEAALNANKVATRDIHGAHLNINEVMRNGIDRIQQLRAGYDANALALQMFGKGTKDVALLQRLTNEELDEGGKTAERLNLKVTKSWAQTMQGYKYALHDLEEVFEAFSINLAEKFVPIFARIAKWFNDTLPIETFQRALAVFGKVLDYQSTTVLPLLLYGLELLHGKYIKLTSSGGLIYEVIKKFNTALEAQALTVSSSLVSRIAAYGSALVTTIGPLVVLAGLIIGAAYAYERYSTAATRAAKAEAEKARVQLDSFSQQKDLLDRYEREEAAVKRTKEGTEAHSKAKERLQLLHEMLLRQYPELKKWLEGEAGSHRTIADAIRLENAEKEKTVLRDIEETKRKLASIDQELAARKALTNQAKAAPAISAEEMAAPDVYRQKIYDLAAAEADRRRKNLAQPMSMGFKAVGTAEALESTKQLIVQRDILSKKLQDNTELELKLKGVEEKPVKDETFVEFAGTGRFEAWKRALAEKQEAQQADHVWSARDELNYWVVYLSIAKKGTGEYNEVIKQINQIRPRVQKEEHDASIEHIKEMEDIDKHDLNWKLYLAAEKLRIERQYRGENSKEVIAAKKALLEAEEAIDKQSVALKLIATKAKRDAELADIEQERTILQSRLSMGLVGSEQEIAAKRLTVLTELKIKLEALDEELFAARGQAEKVAELENQKLEATRKATLEKTKLNEQALANSMRKASMFIDPFTSAFQSGFEKVMHGQLTLTQTLTGLYDIMFDSIIKGLAGMVTEWIGQGLKQLAMSLIMKQTEATSHATMEAEKTAVTGAASYARIGMAAGEGAANAAVTAAQTPFVGWMIAIPAAAAVFAGILALRGMMSAAGGYDIGYENPVTQLHPREMVLPAHLADRVRNMSDDGSVGTPINVHIHATDAAGLDRVLQNRKGTIIQIIEQAIANRRMG